MSKYEPMLWHNLNRGPKEPAPERMVSGKAVIPALLETREVYIGAR